MQLDYLISFGKITNKEKGKFTLKSCGNFTQ